MPGQYGPPPQPQKSGMSGCLIAFFVVLGVVVVGGIVAVILFVTVFGAAVDEGLKGLEENATVGEPEGGIGDTVRDGQFEFTVTSFECGKTPPGFEQLEELGGLEGIDPSEFDTGGGTVPPTSIDEMQYCVAALHVKNVGSESRPFTGTEQRVYAENSDEPYIGIQNFLDPTATEEVIGELAPGQSVDAEVVFVVPKTVKPALLDLHDFWTSGGVTVRVG